MNATMTEQNRPTPVSDTPQEESAAAEAATPLPDTVMWVNWQIPDTLPREEPRPDTPESSSETPEDTPLPTEVKPLETTTPPPATTSWQQVERGAYWNRILTADPDTVPRDIRTASGADDESLTPEEREYRLLRTVNRSWAADHLNASREQISADWSGIRRELADSLGVDSSEQEVFTALSLRAQQEPRRQQARAAYEEEYLRVLEGRETPPPPTATDESQPSEENSRLAAIQAMARAAAENAREESLQHADALGHAVRTFLQLERGPVEQARALWNSPQFLDSVDELAELSEEERSVLYRVVQAEWKKNGHRPLPESTPLAMLHQMIRSGVNMSLNTGQAIGNVATAQLGHLGDFFGMEKLSRFSEAQDKRLRIIEELRRVAQMEVLPIRLGDDASFAEELMVDAAGAVPGVAMAFAGVPGVTLLAASSAGASVADARQRAPEGSQKLQTAAGCLAGATQAAIFKGMSGLGQRLISRTINQFAGSMGKGMRQYALSALKSGAWFTQENINLLLAGKAAQAAEMGLQELAAQADETASHIDWKAYGNSLTDVETNIREAAMNLPFVLIAGGRAALHHFRSPRTILGDGQRLDDWGVDPAMKERVLRAPTLQQQSKLLREALRSSKRWSGAGFLEDIAAKSLRLLQTKDLHLFDNEQVVAQFLSHPGEQALLKSHLRRQQGEELPAPPAEEMLKLSKKYGHLAPQQKLPAAKAPWLQKVMYDWLVKAGLEHPSGKADGEGNPPTSVSAARNLPTELKQQGNYLPRAERLRRGLLAELVNKVEQLSYRFLLNTFTIDTLGRSSSGEESAIRRTEALRRNIPQLVAGAVMQSAMDGHRARANQQLKDYFSKFYLNRRYNSVREPWLKKNSFSDLRQMVEASEPAGRRKTSEPMEVREMRAQYLELTTVVRELQELIPHMEDFHTMMSRGHSPLGAYAAILEREFSLPESGKDWKPEGWDEGITAVDEEAARLRTQQNVQKMKLYSQLTGREPEMVTTSNGRELWRIQRPDGTRTRWHEASDYVANDLSYVYALRLGMPYQREHYARKLQENMRSNGPEFMEMLPQQKRRFSTHDALAAIALNDLHTMWLSNASSLPLGLEYHRRRIPGSVARRLYDGVEPFLSPRSKGEQPQHFRLDSQRTVNPLQLIFARARIYWQRQLDSGALQPAELADFLEKQGALSPERKQELLGLPDKNRRLYRLPEVQELPRKKQHRYVRTLRNLLRERDQAAIQAELATAMSYFSTECLIADLDHARLPDSVKEWIAAAPFRIPSQRGNANRPGLISRGGETSAYPRNSDEFLIRWTNDKSAAFLQEHGERVAELRAAIQDAHSPLRQSPLYARIRELWEPTDSQRKEQCWSYLLNGEQHFTEAGQQLWNMLQQPATGWKRLPEREQELLREELETVVREHPAPGTETQSPDMLEQNLLRLESLLAEKPALRDYALNLRNPGEILHISLDSLPAPRALDDHTTPLSKHDLQQNLPVMQAGGRMETASLPPELAGDERIMPALHLLTALRHQVMDYPSVTPQGIRRRNQYYGGVSGLRPKGVTAEWSVEQPLNGLLQTLRKLENDMEGNRVELTGEVLEPLQTELDLSPLQHVTVYRNPRHPAVQLRMMPGDFASASLHRRRPYVVHSLAGAPLTRRTGWGIRRRVGEAYQDLVHFDSRMDRVTYDEQTHRAGDFFAMVFNRLQARLMDEQALRLGRDADLSNREIILHLAQDTGYSSKLKETDISQFAPDEVVTLSLFRLLLAYEYGTSPETAEKALLELGARFRKDTDLFEQVKENILDSSEHGLDLIDALRAADERMLRNEEGEMK